MSYNKPTLKPAIQPKKKYTKPLQFAAVGAVNTAIDFTVFSVLFFGLEAHILIANSIAYGIAVVNSYILNRKWTFSDSVSGKMNTNEFIRFLFFNLFGLAISNFVVSSLSQFIHPIFAKLLATIASFMWNYATSKIFVYKA